MDITTSTKKRYANSFMNGETVNYAASGLLSFLILICVKQLLKTFFGINAQISAAAGFAAAECAMFLLQKFFVFKGNSLSSLPKQIVFSVINAAVHLGIFSAVSMVSDVMGMHSYSSWLCSFIIVLILNYAVSRILIFDCYLPADKFKNGRIYKVFFRNRFVFLSMAVSLILISFIYLIFHNFPFGDTTVLRMDLYHQYGPLFSELFDRVTNGESFLYSWTSGGGSSFLGNYFNYLSSPFTVILFLFDRKDMPLAITAIVAVKCIVSSGTFTFYLRKSLNRHSSASAAFGVFYAFCAYFLAYFWNVMWLDGMIILPLTVLGIENIINKGKCRLYIFSLIYILFANYYIGYMICIFSVIYFLAHYLISENTSVDAKAKTPHVEKLSLKKIYNNRFINRGIKFAFSSLIAGVLCAFFLLPVYFILTGSSATSDNTPNGFETYFSLFDFIETHFAALETTIRSSGDDVLPNVYCSSLTLLLVPLFMLNKEIKFREKAV
ncbi:MAG: YfhO family protein [Clostridiales bacterium]|nr:YfhO family protein [Clostridiales bacterium]